MEYTSRFSVGDYVMVRDNVKDLWKAKLGEQYIISTMTSEPYFNHGKTCTLVDINDSGKTVGIFWEDEITEAISTENKLDFGDLFE